MDPAQVSKTLRKIAAAIDSSKNPNRQLVVRDLQRVIVAMGLSDDQLREAFDSFKIDESSWFVKDDPEVGAIAEGEGSLSLDGNEVPVKFKVYQDAVMNLTVGEDFDHDLFEIGMDEQKVLHPLAKQIEAIFGDMIVRSADAAVERS